MAKTLSLDDQEGFLKYRYPKADTWQKDIRGTRWLFCSVRLQPCAMCEEYVVRLAYEPSSRPLVWIEEPAIVKEAHGVRTPHLNYDDTLCLFDPANDEWTPAKVLAHTIVPWTSRWLFHYENWLAQGDWQGDTDPSDDTTLNDDVTSNATMEGPNA